MKYKVFGLFIFLLISCISYAQQKTITGLIKDATDGGFLPGVNVAVKGTTRGTATDNNGAFSISASLGDSLQFTYLGKIPVTKVVGQANTIEVVLYDDTKSLGEVTVVAFGTQKKESVVASIQTVKISDLKVAGSNLSTALGGRIPGLISYQTSGEPGNDNAQFFIRGVPTFGYKQDPLYLVDGFEMTKDDFSRIQFDDIESFSVLKDAAATVLYGSRAANGIIIVETKKGSEGPVKINVRIESNVAKPTKIPKMSDGVTYMRMFNEAQMTRDPLMGAFYNEQKIQSTLDGLNPMIYPNVDWYGTIFKPATVNTKSNINISGGGQVANYYVSGGYEHENGLFREDPQNNFSTNIVINRFLLRSNVIFKLSRTTSLETLISGRFERKTGPYAATNDIFSQVMWSNPVDFPAVYQPDEANKYATHTLFGSTFVNGSIKVNPYATMVSGYSDQNESTVVAQANLKQKLDFITKNLELQVRISVDNYSKYAGLRFFNPFFYDLQSYDQITGNYVLWCLNPNNTSSRLGDVYPVRDGSFKYYFESRATWLRQFGKHNASGTLVATLDERANTAGNSNSIYETLPEKNAGISGRFSYDYDSRYFLETAFGYNGSEKFGELKRFGFFPSIAAGWMISNESFWESVKSVISTLKLKGSIGKRGNDAIAGRSGRFFYLSDISTYGSTNAWGTGYRWGESFMNSYGGFTINRYANPDITWEIATNYSAGIEAYFLKDNLKLQIEKYAENRSQIYMKRENFPATAGLSADVSGNVGKVKTWGYDGSIDYSAAINKDLWITARVNLTYADNKFTQLDEKDYADKYLKRFGYNMNQQWGLLAERLFVDEDEIANAPRQDFGQYMAGDIKYKDINGDGVINSNDRVPLGYPTVPKMQYGFGPSIGYKHLDFSFFFEGQSMVSFFIHSGVPTNNDEVVQAIAPFIGRRNALEIVAKDYWSETNPNVYAFWPRLSVTPIDNNTQQSSWWLRDGTFLRLRQIDLGYNINSLEKLGVKNIRIYGNIENLLCFSKFNLWDVEKRRDGLGYPLNKRYNLGITFKF